MDATSNAEGGKRFQRLATTALARLLGVALEEEVGIAIGNPPKNHNFDLASRDRRYVAECKAFTFTSTGNIPSAKITTMREAVSYLNQLPTGTKRFLVVKRSLRTGYSESLAEYFARLNRSMLGDVCVVEVVDDGGTRLICGRTT